jgi:hypothetical protein
MHARSSGDPVEITGEWDSLDISSDLSEVNSCNHSHIVDVPMINVHPRQKEFEFICRFSISRDCAEEVGCLEVDNWYMHLPIFV